MGVLTLSDFRDELRFICGGISTASPAWTTDRLDRRINASYLWCCMPSHYRHPELEFIDSLTLAANDATYTPTTVPFMIVGVNHAEATVPTDTTRRTKLYPMDIREVMSIQKQASKPSTYAYWNTQIVLGCVPSTAYVGQILELHYYRRPLTLSTTSQITLIGDEWDEIILVGAEWRMWISLNEHDRAYEAKQNLGVLVNEVSDVRRLHGEEWDWSQGPTDVGYMRIE